jgi:hypothetical protein
MVSEMKRYKCHALVTLYPAEDGGLEAGASRHVLRLLVRARHRETQHCKFFSTMVTPSEGSTLHPGADHLLVSMLLVGDDAAEYLGPGERFVLWAGSDIGDGVVSRRVFT